MKKTRFPFGHDHANISRHLTGISAGFSKRKMERQLRYLLSVNYVQTLPRADKEALLESKPLGSRPLLRSVRLT